MQYLTERILNNKLSNDTQFLKIEVILLEIQLLETLYSLYFEHYFVHYLRIDLADKMYLLLYWVTFRSGQVKKKKFHVPALLLFWRIFQFIFIL